MGSLASGGSKKGFLAIRPVSSGNSRALFLQVPGKLFAPMCLEALERTEHSSRTAGLVVTWHEDSWTFSVETFLEWLEPELGKRTPRSILLRYRSARSHPISSLWNIDRNRTARQQFGRLARAMLTPLGVEQVALHGTVTT